MFKNFSCLLTSSLLFSPSALFMYTCENSTHFSVNRTMNQPAFHVSSGIINLCKYNPSNLFFVQTAADMFFERRCVRTTDRIITC